MPLQVLKHETTMPSPGSYPAWTMPNKRSQRCLSITLVIILLITLLTYTRPSIAFPRKPNSELDMSMSMKWDAVEGLGRSSSSKYVYGSRPEDGSPPVPYLKFEIKEEDDEEVKV